MAVKHLVLVSALVIVIAASGCVTGGNRPEDVAKALPEVSSFLSDHPDSDLSVTYNSEGYIRSAISEITDKCGPYFKITDYWKIVFDDPFTNSSLTVWIEKDTKQLACLYGEGVDSPAPVFPEPQKKDIVVTGFSDVSVDASRTDFRDGVLYLVLTNPEPETLTIKKVTGTYLDDSASNNTNSGMLSQGDSFTYSLDFSRTVQDSFWIDVDILFDSSLRSNQRSKGSVISGMDINRILQCSKASFEITRYNFYVGTRAFEVSLENTGDIDLLIRPYIRQADGTLTDAADPVEMESGETKTLEINGLNRLMEDILFTSDACPGSSEFIKVKDIAGV